MQLTRFSDYGLRLLMYLAHHAGRAQPVTVAEIAGCFGISRNHLVKVAHFASRQGWVHGARGKGGGLALARPASDYRVGTLVRALEAQGAMINCAEPPCLLAGGCRLKGSLERAMQRFYEELDQQTLAELIAPPAALQLERVSLRRA